MKRSLLLTLLLFANSSFGQGTINFGNSFSDIFRAQIYGPQLTPPYYQDGQTPIGIPSGTKIYTAPLLQGTGFTVALYAGPLSITDASGLVMVASTTFRTGAAAGLFSTLTDVVVPSVLAGEQARLQVRAWDNVGGTVNQPHFATLQGASALFVSGPLGGGGFPSPNTVGWTSFAFYLPEPSTWALAAFSAVAMLIVRFKRRS